MKRIRIKELLSGNKNTSPVTVCGWVRTIRRGKEVAFIELNDGSCLQSLQIVAAPDLPGLNAPGLGTGAALAVQGELLPSPASGQVWELRAIAITLLGPADENFPLQKKRHSLEYLRTIAHLRPRANTFSAVFRLRSALAFAVHRFFRERNFTCIHTPIITASDCEGAGELFRVTTLDPKNPLLRDGEIDWKADFFAEKTGLTVSGQLEGELCALALGDIYTFGPTFRAEDSHTSRHAAEFWMIEPEMAFADLSDDCALAEEFLRYLVTFALNECAEDLDFFNARIEPGLIVRLEALANASFATMTYSEAVERLLRSGKSFEYPVAWGCDLQSEHERFLTEEIIGGPLFVTDYPAELKAFYMRLSDDQRTVAAMDLLVPRVGEIIGGSQREEREEVLRGQMTRKGVSQDTLWWYLETRRWGSCPHAGFGLGFERLIMYISGMENIRDVIPFPRTPGSAKF
jgi:asparaginyl-tRNA synthetase